MTLRKKLTENYRSELETVKKMKAEGIQFLDSAVWDFEGENDDHTLIEIEKVFETLEARLARLESKEEFDAQIYNY
jgi:hypothetical protein